MKVDKMIIKYQLLQVRRQQLEKNGLLKLSEFLVNGDYKGFDKYLHTWAEKHYMTVTKAAYIFSKFEDDFTDLQNYVIESKQRKREKEKTNHETIQAWRRVIKGDK